MQDIATAAPAFRSYSVHPRWNNQAEINQESKVDMNDVASAARHFGETD